MPEEHSGGSGGAENDKQVSAPASAASPATEQLKAFRELAEGVRKRTDLAAKTLGAAGTTALSAIGIAKIADAFPYEGPWLGLVGLLVGFAAMAFALVALSIRLWRTQEPIVMRSDPDEIDDLRGDEERRLVREVYDDMATLNDIASLRAYEARGHRLERSAVWAGPERATALRDRALVISAEVLATQGRAGLIIVRRRATNAITGGWSVVVAVVFFLGLLGFAFGSDSLESKRSGEVALAKSCAEAKEAGVTTLPASCSGAVSGQPDEEETPSAAQTVAETVEALAAAKADCLAAAEKAGEAAALACMPLDRALSAAVNPP